MSCPGFQTQLRWSRKHEQKQRSTSDHQASDSYLHEPRFSTIRTEREVVEDEPGGVEISENIPATGGPFESQANSTTSQDRLSFVDSSNALKAVSDLPTSVERNVENSEYLFAQHASSLFSGKVSQITPSPVHLPTLLIEYWFNSICPMRSTFDSDINYNRKLAWISWSTSEVASYSMQNMSALCLIQVMPQLRTVLPSLQAKAVTTVRKHLSKIQTSPLSTVTSDLVFAVFTLGTSLHWTGLRVGASQSYAWCQVAHNLLERWSSTLNEEEVLVHAYFAQALHYWEMLLAVAGFGSHVAAVSRKHNLALLTLQPPTASIDGSQHVSCEEQDFGIGNGPPVWTRPNSWCGISSEVIRLFGQVLALCRRTNRRLDGDHLPTASLTNDMVCDAAIAQDLHDELSVLDVRSMVVVEELQGFPVETQDANTPIVDLAQTAEAYRQAALVHLYITFDDLTIYGAAGMSEPIEKEQTSRAHAILRLALHLISILEQIPMISGSRCIHAMLYLTAAAGLRYPMDLSTVHAVEPVPDELYDLLVTDPIPLESLNCNLDLDFGSPDSTMIGSLLNPHELLGPAAGQTDTSTIFVPQLVTAAANARQFIQYRLNTLQQMLPHGSSNTMLQLVNAIWRSYDDPLTVEKVHWLDVLQEIGSDAFLC